MCFGFLYNSRPKYFLVRKIEGYIINVRRSLCEVSGCSDFKQSRNMSIDVTTKLKYDMTYETH
jgi:hypothetical protein